MPLQADYDSTSISVGASWSSAAIGGTDLGEASGAELVASPRYRSHMAPAFRYGFDFIIDYRAGFEESFSYYSKRCAPYCGYYRQTGYYDISLASAGALVAAEGDLGRGWYVALAGGPGVMSSKVDSSAYSGSVMLWIARATLGWQSEGAVGLYVAPQYRTGHSGGADYTETGASAGVRWRF